jgi:hypothetical protein
MTAEAVVMGLVGFLLLYGGLAACMAIAWYHGQRGDQSPAEEAASTEQ